MIEHVKDLVINSTRLQIEVGTRKLAATFLGTNDEDAKRWSDSMRRVYDDELASVLNKVMTLVKKDD